MPFKMKINNNMQTAAAQSAAQTATPTHTHLECLYMHECVCAIWPHSGTGSPLWQPVSGYLPVLLFTFYFLMRKLVKFNNRLSDMKNDFLMEIAVAASLIEFHYYWVNRKRERKIYREREKDSSIYVLFVILSNPFLIFLTKIPFGQNWPCSPIELARHYREECQRGKGQSAEAGRDKKNVFEHTENAWLAENVEPTTVQLISN